ncbi:MAG: hypothetical protein IM638_17275 [Bacteroidetes bacterium]|nr:hypothetical protein [Bacteroidota bacterium]
MKKLFLKYRKSILGALLGAVGGYAYYYFVGCSSGSCAITSKPLNSTLYGVLMGVLLVNSFNTKSDHASNTENNN